jgi:pilus assembly protein CpaF
MNMHLFGRKIPNVAGEPLERQPDATPVQAPPVSDAKAPSARPGSHTSSAWMEDIRDQVLQRIEPTVAVRLTPAELATQVMGLVVEIATRRSLLLNEQEQSILAGAIVDDMIGHGPIEPLLRDDTVADILVNGPKMIYVERRGKLELTNLHFHNNAHVLHVAQRIASAVGRRIDESSPMLDARLADGSRVNVIINPLSLKGACISIRKFSRNVMDFSKFSEIGTLSPELGRALEIAARCRLNIIISGGTGSGKTTLLNALSGMIDFARTDRHNRRRGRAPASTASRRSARDAAAEHRGAGPDRSTGSSAQCTAHATRPDNPRGGARFGSLRHDAGHEHGPQRLDVHDSRELGSRRLG